MTSYTTDSNSGAFFSDDRRYRYTLWRRWGGMLPNQQLVTFIGLNPSTADESEGDPTIRRCVDYAKRWGFQGMIMLNIFAFRATDPKVMRQQSDPVGPKNDAVIRRVCEESPKIVLCWGHHGAFMNRDMSVMVILRHMLNKVWCFGRTSCGQPLHPLYLQKLRELEPMIGGRDD